jgi:hypothetical protein
MCYVVKSRFFGLITRRDRIEIRASGLICRRILADWQILETTFHTHKHTKSVFCSPKDIRKVKKTKGPDFFSSAAELLRRTGRKILPRIGNTEQL